MLVDGKFTTQGIEHYRIGRTCCIDFACIVSIRVAAQALPDGWQNRMLSRNGCMRGVEVVSRIQDQVKSLSPDHRVVIALHSPEANLRNRTANVLFREKAGQKPPSLLSSPFSAVRFLEQKSRKPGIICGLCVTRSADFSAVQTAWRRGKDSNPRYRSGTCKSRRIRKLHGISSFKNSLRLPARRAVGANRCGFQRSWKANPWRFRG
jgi:hypothetical protein